ncbi:glutathione S-transferase family protein [Hyphococcus sp.]|jgi:glutathione S-transferase|uniref:glutathione S-transferase family protein n=1 Tax=Hyphococcus sp. TaxID=2038636 RepID=UPI003D0A3FF1
MTDLILGIGDKNLSSWSLRPWFLMTQAGVPFTEENIRLDRPETRAILKEKSPSGLVPYLIHGDVKIWDSLAIMEYMSELFPDKKLWPEDKQARALARSVSAEMHSGFSALRNVWPMMFLRKDMQHTTQSGVARDIERINDLWTMCRKEYGSGGDFLFGRFSIADAMYAPVVSRFVTYGPVKLSPEAAAYRDMMFALPAMKKWGDGAKAELASE